MSRVGTLSIKTNPKRGALGVGESVATSRPTFMRSFKWTAFDQLVSTAKG